MTRFAHKRRASFGRSDGKSTRRRTHTLIRRVLIAILAAFSAIAATIVLSVPVDYLIYGHSMASSNNLVGLALFLTASTLLGTVALGMIDWLLRTLDRTEAIHYAAVSMVVSIATVLLAMLIWRAHAFDGLPESWTRLVRPVLLCATIGAIAGLAFWRLARRCDSRAPFLDDVF